MTICPINSDANYIMEKDKIIELNSVGKQYQVNLARNYAKADFNEFWALDDITLDILRGQVFGIIGRNGAGKTTLLNILAKVLNPTKGEVSIKGKVLGLFNLGTGFQDELTGRENIFLNGAILGACRKDIEDKLEAIINFSELGDFINMPLGSYSQGMRLRLGFSIVVNLDFDILVIDEILAVGDNLFQQKCFQALMDFKRAGKTIVITTQSLDLIQRLCDKVTLLDHGKLLFYGSADETITQYRALLNTEKFFVGPPQKSIELVKSTKRWADNTSEWGQKLGAKEIMINSVEFINQSGRTGSMIKSQEGLKIKIGFTAKNMVKEPHFGVAIFRGDGVYCYGPNTVFDGLIISEIKPGKGYFILNYKKILLAPGAYRLSVAIWDKHETVAFDHHYGCYNLIVEGTNNNGALLNMPFYNSKNILARLIGRPYTRTDFLSLALTHYLANKPNELAGLNCLSIKLMNFQGLAKKIFNTNEPVIFNLEPIELNSFNKNYYLWLGIYRDDDIFCQDLIMPVRKRQGFKILFHQLPLLPGGYKVSLGLVDIRENKFLAYRPNIESFNMVFNRKDHGTVYLEHRWEWRLPK